MFYDVQKKKKATLNFSMSVSNSFLSSFTVSIQINDQKKLAKDSKHQNCPMMPFDSLPSIIHGGTDFAADSAKDQFAHLMEVPYDKDNQH